MQAEETCLNEANTVCINMWSILYAIIFANLCQVIFESSMLCALEISLKPSAFDKLQNSELENEEQD